MKFIVPFPPGNSSDVAARLIGEQLGKKYNVPFIVENRVGAAGRGESVWLAMFLRTVLGDFVPFCEARGDAERAARYRRHREDLRRAANEAAWDGDWYLRGWYDDGEPLGSHRSDECRIDALVPKPWPSHLLGEPQHG